MATLLLRLLSSAPLLFVGVVMATAPAAFLAGFHNAALGVQRLAQLLRGMPLYPAVSDEAPATPRVLMVVRLAGGALVLTTLALLVAALPPIT